MQSIRNNGWLFLYHINSLLYEHFLNKGGRLALYILLYILKRSWGASPWIRIFILNLILGMVRIKPSSILFWIIFYEWNHNQNKLWYTKSIFFNNNDNLHFNFSRHIDQVTLLNNNGVFTENINSAMLLSSWEPF